MKRDFLDRILRAPEDESGSGGGGSDDKSDKSDKKDDKSDDSEESDDEEESEEDVAERTNALNIYRALKDPKKAGALIKALAEDAGILGDKSSSSKEKKNEIVDTLREALGEDYHWLADKMGPAIEKLLKGQETKFEQRGQEQKARDLERETDSAIDGMLKDHKDFKLHSKAVQRLIKEYNPVEGQSQRAFLERMYKLAKLEAGETLGDKRNKNRNDVSLRLASLGGKDDKNEKVPDRPSRRQAIERAYQKLEDSGSD